MREDLKHPKIKRRHIILNKNKNTEYHKMADEEFGFEEGELITVLLSATEEEVEWLGTYIKLPKSKKEYGDPTQLDFFTGKLLLLGELDKVNNLLVRGTIESTIEAWTDIKRTFYPSFLPLYKSAQARFEARHSDAANSFNEAARVLGGKYGIVIKLFTDKLEHGFYDFSTSIIPLQDRSVEETTS